MLTPEDKQRIAAEERYRAEVRDGLAKEKSAKRGNWILNTFLLLFGLVIALAVVASKSSTSYTENLASYTENLAMVGTLQTFKGTAGERGISTFANLPYFQVIGPSMKVNCYYTEEIDAPPRPGTIVTVAGTVTTWTDNLLVSLRPCTLL